MMRHDETDPRTCDACLSEDEKERGESAFRMDDGTDEVEWLQRLLEEDLPLHTYAPGCRMNVWMEEGRILACGCHRRQLIPDTGVAEPKVLLRHIATCSRWGKMDAPPTDGNRGPRSVPLFKGILRGRERRPNWFWETWVRRPRARGSADHVEW